ncbi:sulfite exporter TauE/SafE family protein [Tissierella creatinophila]|uniref:Probable membrane transporter protein n=1 Tax=Tissierella creatinophila DSM 6911 TaxID=1123403 RepID=A0A1U7M6A0_TISCR|nr:sulfite exporter TauE/SafE family protein [Tissierella creatinophila]OLS02854.1 sulfite exporter TauE/SafE [Tissierella creatinophila DSM 6911]
MKTIIIGFLSGIISGMGIGGGTLLIPSLVLIIGLSQIEAQGVNLITFIPIATIAIFTHRKKGNIEFKYTKKIAVSGILSAIIASLIAVKISPDSLKKYFSVFLLLMGLFEFFKKEK